MPVVAVGLITDFVQAEAILGTGDADLIALARAILYDPRWPWHAAAHFGAAVTAPSQYFRSQPRHSRVFSICARMTDHVLATNGVNYINSSIRAKLGTRPHQ